MIPEDGNHKTFTKLFHQHKNPVYGFVLRMLQDRESAADVTQEVFVKLFNALNNQSDIGNIKGWLFVSARNLCLNKLRDDRKKINLSEIAGLESPNCLESMLQTLDFGHAFAKLEGHLREALILREYEGFSYLEISEILSISEAAVKSLLFRARTQLKEILENNP